MEDWKRGEGWKGMIGRGNLKRGRLDGWMVCQNRGLRGGRGIGSEPGFTGLKDFQDKRHLLVFYSSENVKPFMENEWGGGRSTIKDECATAISR